MPGPDPEVVYNTFLRLKLPKLSELLTTSHFNCLEVDVIGSHEKLISIVSSSDLLSIPFIDEELTGSLISIVKVEIVLMQVLSD